MQFKISNKHKRNILGAGEDDLLDFAEKEDEGRGIKFENKIFSLHLRLSFYLHMLIIIDIYWAH